MSNFDTLSPISAGLPGSAPQIFTATTDDALSVITAAGYVSDKVSSGVLKAYDLLFINYDVDGTPGFGEFMVSVSGGSLLPRSNESYANALTAHAGGGQGSALQLYAGINRVTTVATAADSVKLPAAKAGMQYVVINAAAANSMNVYPATGEAINALSANAAFAMAANKTAIFYCAVDGVWNSILTA